MDATLKTPELHALQTGDPSAWDEAFAWLWPVAYAVAQTKLGSILPGDVEDTAIETLEEIVEKTRAVTSIQELKPLTAAIAHNRSVSRIRMHFAEKRGSGQTASLDELDAGGHHSADSSDATTPLAELDQMELAALLGELQAGLKAEQQAMLRDFFLRGLSYEQLAAKHGLAMGTVGVYLKRGLEAMRKVAEKNPALAKELEAFLR